MESNDMTTGITRRILTAGAVAAGMIAAAGGAAAECAFQNQTPLKSLSAGFEAWKAATDAMAECGNFEAELDQEFRTKQAAAFAANPALYQIGGVSNATITPLINEGTIRPLDDYLAEYGASLSPNQLIRVNGQVMAVAMMVNAQHLMYRADILDDLEIAVPETWDEVLAAAEKIKEAGVVDYPLGATMASGWNIAQDFNNMYYGMQGEFLDAEGQPTLNTEAGIAALEKMKALTAYMDPEYLVSDSTFVQQQFQQGKIAMANLWSSRAAAMNDEAESQVVGMVESAAAPRAIEGGPPATTLWWDGVVLARNMDDAAAEEAFRVVMEGLDREMVEANNDEAIWLIEGYRPTEMAKGAIETAMAEPTPPSYPSTSQMGLLHTALGNELPSFFTGNRSAEATLVAAEEAYVTAAREAGILE